MSALCKNYGGPLECPPGWCLSPGPACRESIARAAQTGMIEHTKGRIAALEGGAHMFVVLWHNRNGAKNWTGPFGNKTEAEQSTPFRDLSTGAIIAEIVGLEYQPEPPMSEAEKVTADEALQTLRKKLAGE